MAIKMDFNKTANIVAEILAELESATNKHPAFNSWHEGYAILKEELDELWDLIKINHKNDPSVRPQMRKEAIQVAAMGIRFIYDCCEDLKENWW